MTCAFCSDVIKERLIEEGKFTMVVLSNPRLAAGHLLVIPKRHVLKFSELKSKETVELFRLLGKYQDKVLGNLGKGTEIRQNYKPYFKNSETHVNHFHFHIVPREENDGIAKQVDVHRKPLYIEMSGQEFKKVRGLLSDDSK